MNNDHSRRPTRPRSPAPHGADDLDSLLRTWHELNADRAAAGRDLLLARLRDARRNEEPAARIGFAARLGRILTSRALKAAASLVLFITSLALITTAMQTRSAAACDWVMSPEGGRLEAVDGRGDVIGPCALAHTDVRINVIGPFTRVNVRQEYRNPYAQKIEAVYTFPLDNRAAVDGMTMTIPSPGGDRVIVAEAKERRQARQIYDSAREAGHVAGLLEQERPNIFTQSVANIEPGAKIFIDISYVETLEAKDGEFSLHFPMTVAPRYMPGSPIRGSMADQTPRLPPALERRYGVILKAPATFERTQMQFTNPPDQQGGVNVSITPPVAGSPAPAVGRLIDAAIPIEPPSNEFRMRDDIQKRFRSRPGIDFYATYADGIREFGQISGEGLGHISGRWFYFDPTLFDRFDREGFDGQSGTGYEPDTDQVPDASRVSPQPVRPPMRAGHDISVSVHIETGGSAIVDYNSDLHEIVCTDGPRYRNLGDKINLALKNRQEIPNRDFVLHWKTLEGTIQEAAFAYLPKAGKGGEAGGAGVPPAPADAADPRGFFTLVLAPPARPDKENILPRELIFVLDTSGSMSGEPIEKAKAVMARAIDAMWPEDAFNMITFSGDTHILWDRPRSNTEANRAEAQQFLASRAGDGGTEMMKAIDAALAPTASSLPASLTPEQLAGLPADGRAVSVRAKFDSIEAEVMKSAVMNPALRVRPDLALKLTSFHFPVDKMFARPDVVLWGKWATVNGERVLQVDSAQNAADAPQQPVRIVVFLTDGQVGNDDAIIQAVRDHAKTTRVFSFGIGDSPNRHLLDGMAAAGRGEVEYVNLNNNPDAAVQRFARRIASPVLTDISLTFGPDVTVSDTIPALDSIPDLFDVKPLVIHGRFALNSDREKAQGADGKIAAVLRGRNAAGPYERALSLDLASQPAAPVEIGAKRAGGQGKEEDPHRVIGTLWARAMVDELVKSGGGDPQPRGRDIIALGESFNIMTPLTSFVAVEKARVTVAGRPALVPIPIELPEGERWESFFDGWRRNAAQQARYRALERENQSLIRKVKDEGIDAALRDVQQSQLDLRYGDALATLGAVLTVDPANPAALATRDVINARNHYQTYRNRINGLDGSAYKNAGTNESLEIPRANVTGPDSGANDVRLGFENTRSKFILNGTNKNGANTDFAWQEGRTLEDQSDGIGEIKEANAGSVNFGAAVGSDSGLFDELSLKQGSYDFSNSPAIDLDAALDQGRDLTAINRYSLRDLSETDGDGAVDQLGRNSSDQLGSLSLLQGGARITGGVDAQTDQARLSFGDHTRDVDRLRAYATATDPNSYFSTLEDAGQPAIAGGLPIDGSGRQKIIDANGRLKAWKASSNTGIMNYPEDWPQPDARLGVNGTVTLDDLYSITSYWGAEGGGIEQQPAGDDTNGGADATALDGAGKLPFIINHWGYTADGTPPAAPIEASLPSLGGSELASRESKVSDAALAEQLHRLVAANLDRVGALVKQGKLKESLQLLDETLFVDPENAQAKAIHQAILNTVDPPTARRTRQQLQQTRWQIDFDNNTLAQIIAAFSQSTGLKIAVDWEALQAIGVAIKTPITLKHDSIAYAAALDAVLTALDSQGRAQWYVARNGTILISVASRTKLNDDAEKALDDLQAKRQAAAEEFQRDSRCHRVIDQRLWPVAFPGEAAADAAAPAASDSSAAATASPLAVAVLVADVRSASIDRLKAAGLAVDDVSRPTRVVAGRADAAKLAELAMIPNVRKIEPVGNAETPKR